MSQPICSICNKAPATVVDYLNFPNGLWYCLPCYERQKKLNAGTQQTPVSAPCIQCGAPATTLDNGADWYCNSCYTNLQSARQMYAKKHRYTPPPPPILSCTSCGIPITVLEHKRYKGICAGCYQQKQRTATAAKQHAQNVYNKFWQSQYQKVPQQQQQGGTNVAISCTIYWDDSIMGYAVSCGYKPQFIDFLKQNIPASDRAYHPNTKTWTFQEKYFDIMVKMAQTVFGPGSVNAKKRSTSSTGTSSPVGVGSSADPLTLAYARFARLLPHEVLKKAYREAAHVLHPDKDPSNAQRMTDLNECWAQIKATLP